MVEAAGIPTVGISIMRSFTEAVRPPRSLFVKWPMGHPLGEPGNRVQQLRVLGDLLAAFENIKEPGKIIDLPYRWRRHEDLTGKKIDWKS